MFAGAMQRYGNPIANEPRVKSVLHHQISLVHPAYDHSDIR